MSIVPDGFCGNCGLARPPQAVVCPQCGKPFDASALGFDPSYSTLQAPTQVASTPPQALWQSSSPTYITGTPPSPTPTSRWTARLLIGQGVIVVALLAVILVVLLHPFAGGNSSQPGAGGGALIPATSTTAPLPTLAPTPSYVSGLSSSDLNVFTHALGESLQAYDTASLLSHVTTTQFLIMCDQGNDFQGQCDTSWAQIQEQITSHTLLLDILTQGLMLVNPSALPSYCPGVGGSGFSDMFAVGSFEQETSMPLSHIGGAVLGIICSCGSSPNPTYAWGAVYFC